MLQHCLMEHLAHVPPLLNRFTAYPLLAKEGTKWKAGNLRPIPLRTLFSHLPPPAPLLHCLSLTVQELGLVLLLGKTSSTLQATRCRPRAAGHALQATRFRPRAAGHALQATRFRPRAAGHALQATRCRPRASGHALQATRCRPRASGHALQATRCRPRAAGHALQAMRFRPHFASL